MLQEGLDLVALPLSGDEVWQAHVRIDSPWLLRDGKLPAWKVLVVDASASDSSSVIHYDVISQFPTVEVLWEQLVVAMTSPMLEAARRPRLIEFQSEAYEEHLRERLLRTGVQTRLRPELNAWQHVIQSLSPQTTIYPA